MKKLNPIEDISPTAKPSASLAANIQFIQQLLASPDDLVIRNAATARGQTSIAIVCIDGLADKQFVQQLVQMTMALSSVDPTSVWIGEHLTLQEIKRSSDWDDSILSLLSGDTLLLVEGSPEITIAGSKGWKSRSVEEPQTEALIRGPRDGFTEDIRTNTALVRRRIRDPKLRLESYRIGRRAQKEVILAYIEGIVNPMLIQEVRRRVETIDMDDPEGSGFIEQWIMDNTLTPYPQILNTERPDKVAGAVMQGRVGILVDGTPFQLILPITLTSFIQSPEDYYQNWLLSSVLRVLRVFAVFIALFLPGIYIALLEFHHGLLPSKLAFSVAGSREGVPFPAVVETFLMEGTLELLREAGIRLPKSIGQTIGVVGGLVIGEAAVTAGIVSPVMVVVVAVTAIASFAIPSYGFAISIRLLRFGIMLAGSIFGLYGIVLALILNCIHIVNLKSFGVPYTAPLAPLRLGDWSDFIIRMPIRAMQRRPDIMETMNEGRQKRHEKEGRNG
ncbi:GerA spore germination protein [Paenibacillus curdlanolyticus YK9]|uniref:GerA spore germination protein n=1 Tax=Paenibacillus curdlanolyticus YK9 TaxID=717606 RepID=E0IGI2_9BACL|nr:spore germination protein [Paenibacillus curdlanolyticus]EFM08422.1 GerA spore germination protein [Paenibacillus curdlanolyticus YK9]